LQIYTKIALLIGDVWTWDMGVG